MAFMILTVILLGCPETTEMVDDVIQPVSPGIEPPTEPLISDPQEPATPPGDAEPGDDLSEPTTPPPGDAEPGGDLSEPTAPTDAEDPTEDPSIDDSGAGGLGG